MRIAWKNNGRVVEHEVDGPIEVEFADRPYATLYVLANEEGDGLVVESRTKGDRVFVRPRTPRSVCVAVM